MVRGLGRRVLRGGFGFQGGHGGGDVPEGFRPGYRAVNLPEAVGGVEEGHAGFGRRVKIPLGVPDVEGPPQAVALHHQGDVVRLGQAGAAGVLIVSKIFSQAMGLEKGLNIPEIGRAHV